MAHKLMILGANRRVRKRRRRYIRSGADVGNQEVESLIRSCGRETALTGQICPLHQNGLLIHLRSA